MIAPRESLTPSGERTTSLALQRKIASVRARQARVVAALGMSMLITGFLVLWAAVMLLDWTVELPRWARAVLLLVNVALLGWLLWRRLIRPLRAVPDDDSLALRVERFFPELQGRLIAAVQLGRGAGDRAASAGLVRALVAETEGVVAPLEFKRVIGATQLRRWLGVAALTASLAAAGYYLGGNASRDLLRRSFLANVPVPRKTGIIVEDGSRRIGRGETIWLRARATGVIPRRGQLALRFDSGRLQKVELPPAGSKRGEFAQRLEQVTESFSYRVLLNDNATGGFRITVVPRPAVASLSVVQHYPDYIGLPPVRRALGDLTVLAGSRLVIEGVANKPVARADLRLIGRNETRALEVLTNASQFRGEFIVPTNGLTGFLVQLTDRESIRSSDEAVYRLEILLDRPPGLKIIYPQRKEELITAQGTLLLAFEASDDYGLGQLRLYFRSDSYRNGVPQPLEFDLADARPRALRRRFQWKLGEQVPGLMEGTQWEYWLEGEDLNSATGPGHGVSDHFALKVVSEDDKRADLLNRMSDSLSTIGEVAQEQENLTRDLGEMIFEKTR